jgi:hypothetical protein
MDNARYLAVGFSKVLHEWLTPAEMKKVVKQNAAWKGTKFDNCCASHNYCDANMAMLEAWVNLFGFEPRFLNDPDDENSLQLCSEAWDLAKDSGFDIKVLES